MIVAAKLELNLLLDVRMEPMSGLQLHEELIARSVRNPVLFLSGHGDIPMVVAALMNTLGGALAEAGLARAGSVLGVDQQRDVGQRLGVDHAGAQLGQVEALVDEIVARAVSGSSRSSGIGPEPSTRSWNARRSNFGPSLAIARWRSAALQDEAGQALDQALLQHGAPARPVPERPILWMKNPRTGRA